MAVTIRLARFGSKKAPFYRVVVTDARSPRGGRFLEVIGTFEPSKKGSFVIKRDRLDYWKSVGAKASETVSQLAKKT